MIGIVPSTTKTFDVIGSFTDAVSPIEGSLYYDAEDNRLFMFSSKFERSSPDTGYFPIWNGDRKIISKYSNEKYLDRDVIRTDLASMSSTIDSSKAEQIRYLQLKSINEHVLQPAINQGDNMFTQIIKTVIRMKHVTMTDLVYMSGLSEKVIRNYYSALTKITFMRLDRWKIWLGQIFHLSYKVTVRKPDDSVLVSYSWPEDKFETGSSKFDSIIASNSDPFKKMVRVIMIKENIVKSDLKSDEVDDYTVNNMLTTINTPGKSLSAQLFSRFIRMTGLNFSLELFELDRIKNKVVSLFIYSE